MAYSASAEGVGKDKSGARYLFIPVGERRMLAAKNKTRHVSPVGEYYRNIAVKNTVEWFSDRISEI